jgi:hypothetical protein
MEAYRYHEPTAAGRSSDFFSGLGSSGCPLVHAILRGLRLARLGRTLRQMMELCCASYSFVKFSSTR